MKYFNGLNMGEGIAGPSTIGASTTSIYSCMGIALVNTVRQFGGLYHYPSLAMSNGNVTSTIRQMINDIRPDTIHLTPASSNGFSSGGSDPRDIEDLAEFLRTHGGCGLVMEEATGSAQLVWSNGAPVFNQKPSKVGIHDAEESAPSAQTRAKMSAGKRELEAGIWYYGGDGEVPGVLEQGLTTTRASARGRCVIL